MTLISKLKAASAALIQPTTSASTATTTQQSWGAFIPQDWSWNFWQQGKDPISKGAGVPTVHACVNLIAGVVSAMPPSHRAADGQAIRTSAAHRLMRRPTPTMTWPEFTDLAVRSVLISGDFFAYIRRNDRSEPFEFVPLSNTGTRVFAVEDDSGATAVFYDLGTDADKGRIIVPQRDVLHMRSAVDPANPLKGISPLRQAAVAVGLSATIHQQQHAFHENGQRPSAVLTTDEELTRDQIKLLRDAMDQQAGGRNTGRMPILSSGMKWQSISLSAEDTHLIDLLGSASADIAAVFGVPAELVAGEGSSSQYRVHRDLLSGWLSLSLNPLIEKLERSLDTALNVKDGERIHFDAQSLFRMDPAANGEHMARLVSNGILTADEARAGLGYQSIEGGSDLRIPAQLESVNQPEPEPLPAPEPVRAITDQRPARRLVRALH